MTTSEPTTGSTAESTTEYTVVGMTCDHCVASVTEEVTDLAGVRGVEVDLDTGTLRVTSEGAVSRDDIDAAVQEAGYQLA